MSWATIMANLGTALTTAGATLSPPIVTVLEGEPDTVTIPTIVYSYGGDREGALVGNTLSLTSIDEAVDVVIAWPGSVRFPTGNAALERWLRDATRAVKHVLWGDMTLGGSATALIIEPTTADWRLIGGALCRTAAFTVWVAEVDVDDIAP